MSNDSSRPSFLRNALAWIGIGIGHGIARMPWALYRPMAWVLARLMRLLMRERGHIARINIRLCFPDMSRTDQEKLWRDSFDSMAFSLFEFARGWWGKLRPRDAVTPIEGMQNLHNALARGKGVILVSAHLTTLEYCNMMLCHNQPVAGMYRPFDNAALEWSVRHGRMRHASGMFPRGELRPVLRHLKSNGILWFAPDQETRRGDSVFVPFFGRQAWSLTSTHQLSKLSGAAVLPFFHQRQADGSYRLEIGPALENFPGEDARSDTAQVMGLFESMIRRCPEQYLWMHARFKRQADGGGSPY